MILFPTCKPTPLSISARMDEHPRGAHQATGAISNSAFSHFRFAIRTTLGESLGVPGSRLLRG